VSLCPALFGLAGRFIFGRAGAGDRVLVRRFNFAGPTVSLARRLFFISILYLPLLLGLM